MRFLVLMSILCLASLLATTALADTYTYKWTADNGTTQYTQIPPVDRTFTKVKTSSRAAKPVGTTTASTEEATSTGEKALADTEARAQTQKVEIAQQRASNCEAAKKNLVIMESRPRVRIPTENGEYRVLSEAEKQAKIEDTRKIILQDCN